MVGLKLSAKAQLKLDMFMMARRKYDRIYSLVEQYSGLTKGDDAMMGPIARTATEVARMFMNNGYGIMADQTNQIAMLAKRAVPKPSRLRTFRELVSSVRAAMDHAERVIIEEDKAEHAAPSGEAPPA